MKISPATFAFFIGITIQEILTVRKAVDRISLLHKLNKGLFAARQMRCISPDSRLIRAQEVRSLGLQLTVLLAAREKEAAATLLLRKLKQCGVFQNCLDASRQFIVIKRPRAKKTRTER